MRLSLSVLIVCALWTPTPAADPARPNVVFLLADDLGYGDLGCFGQKKIKTPNLDRLATQGMKLTRHYAGSNVCAPSRCALMTGLHPGHGREATPSPTRPLRAVIVRVYRTGLRGRHRGILLADGRGGAQGKRPARACASRRRAARSEPAAGGTARCLPDPVAPAARVRVGWPGERSRSQRPPANR